MGRSIPTALATAIGVDKAHISRAIQSLAQAGYVTITPEIVDRRIVTISLTEAGQVAAGQVEQVMMDWVAIVSRGVNPADLDTLNAVFDAFYDNAQQYFAAGPTD